LRYQRGVKLVEMSQTLLDVSLILDTTKKTKMS